MTSANGHHKAAPQLKGAPPFEPPPETTAPPSDTTTPSPLNPVAAHRWLTEQAEGAADPGQITELLGSDLGPLADQYRQVIEREATGRLTHSAKLARLSLVERFVQVWRARTIRRKRGDLHLLKATAEVDVERHRLDAEGRIARMQAKHDTDVAEARIRRERLMDPTSRLASVVRTQRVLSVWMTVVIAIGIIWCAIVLGQGLGSPVWAFVDLLFQSPLLIIITVQSIAARNGKVFPSEERRKTLRRSEIALFVGTTALQVSPVVPGIGKWVNTTTLLVHLAAPAFLVTMVAFYPQITGFLSKLLTDLYVEFHEADKRLDGDVTDILDRAITINKLWEAGKLRSANPNDPTDRTAGPSVNHVIDTLRIGKQDCQKGVDAWRRLYGSKQKG